MQEKQPIKQREEADSDQEHYKRALATQMIEQLKIAADQRVERLAEENKKEAEKKKRENEDFDAAINLACVLSEIRLTLHFERMIDRLISASHDHDVHIAKERAHRYFENFQDPKYTVTLPLPNQNPEQYKTMALLEAQSVIRQIRVKEVEVVKRMHETWGKSWEDGLEKQTQKAREILETKKADFFKPDIILGTDKHPIDPEAQEKIRKQLTPVIEEISLCLKDQLIKLKEKMAREAELEKEQGGIIIGESAPQAPAMDKKKKEAAPAAPELGAEVEAYREELIKYSDSPEAKKIVRFTELELVLEPLVVNLIRKLDLGAPIIPEHMKKDDKGVEYNANTGIRIGKRYYNNVIGALDDIIDAAKNYLKDEALLKNLTAMKVEAQTFINKIRPQSMQTPAPSIKPPSNSNQL